MMEAKKDKYLKWRIIEYLHGDFCDSSPGVELKTPKPKHKARLVKNRRAKIADIPRQSRNEKAVSTEIQCFSPELDTCRIFFPCADFIDLDKFLPSTASRKVRSVIRTAKGDIYDDTEYYRNEMSNSWWGKMTVTKEYKKFGRTGKNSTPVLSFEFSVAKWWHFTSGVNSGEEPSAGLILAPCVHALKQMGVENFSKKSMRYIAKKLVETAEIRRFDLSLNFDVPVCYTPSEYVTVLSRCYLNRQTAIPYGDGSISFGTEKSPYRVIFYDKEKEQKHYYGTKDKRPNIVFWEDPETGAQFAERPEDWKEKKYLHKEFDFNAERKLFYKNNKELFKNKLRFEVQFRTKFIQENNLLSSGMKEIDNVIRLGVLYWRNILDRFDEQLNRGNFDYTEDEKDPVCRALDTIESRRDSEIYSRTVANNMLAFIQDCYKKGWKDVRDRIGKSLFSRYSKWVRDELDYDVKVLDKPAGCPIMRNMFTISREGRMVRDFALIPSPIQHCVVNF